MNRKVVIGSVLFVSICLAIIAFGFWCLNTTAGARWLINSAGNFAGIEMTTAEIEGALLDTLSVKELRLVWAEGEIQVAGLNLAIRRFNPLTGLLAIGELRVERLVLQLDEETEDPDSATDEYPGADVLLAALPGWLEVVIDQLGISGFVYRSTTDPDDEVVIADRISGQYRLAGQRLVAEEFAYHSPYVELDGDFAWQLARSHLEMTANVYLPETSVESALLDSIDVPVRFPGHIELDGDWNHFNGPVQFGVKDAAGKQVWLSGTASGSWRGLRFDDLAGRYLGGTIAGVLDMTWVDAYRLEGQVSGQELNFSTLIDTAEGKTSFDTTGELFVPYDDQPLQAGIDAVIHAARFKGHALQGKAAGQWLGQELVGLHLDLAGEAARLWAKGVPAQRVDIDLEVSDLAMYQQGVSGQVAAGGWLNWSEGSFAGEIDCYGEKLAWQDLKVQRVELQLRHRAGDQSVVLSFSGDDWSHGDQHLQQLAGMLSGTLNDHRFELAADSSIGQFAMSGTGRYHPGIWTGRFEQLIGSGTPWGRWELSEPATATWDNGVLSLKTLALAGDAGTRLQLELDSWGSADRASAMLSWTGFKLEWLQPLAGFDNLVGDAQGHVEYIMLDGQPWSINGKATAHGEITDEDFALAYRDLDLDFDWGQTGLRATGKTSIGSGESVQLKATATGPPKWQWPVEGLVAELQWQGLKLSRLNRFLQDAQAEGASDGNLFFALDGDQLERIEGQVAATGRLLQEERDLGPRSLLVDLSWKNQDFQCTAKIAGAKGSHAEISLTAIQRPALAWPDSGQIEFKVDGLSLAAIEPLLPQDIDFSGVIDGRAEGHWEQAGIIEMGGHFNLQQSLVSWDSETGQVLLPLRDARAEWRWADSSLDGTFSLHLADRGEINGSWQLPLPARWPTAIDPDAPLQILVDGTMQATGILSAIGPWLVQDVHGTTRLQLNLQGTLKKPDLRGSIFFTDGSAYLPEVGIQIEDIQLQSELTGDRLQIDALSLRSGSGALTGHGEIIFDRWQLARYRLEISGEDFRAVNFPELQMTLSPDLVLSGTPDRLELRGSVLVPLLAISGSRGTPEVQPSKDVVVITTVEERQELAFATDIRVDVELGEQVTVKTGGVDTRLTGGGTVTMGPTGELLARGEIKLVSGSFRAHGVNLAIRQGVLSYQGGILTNPDLRIFAAREVGEVLAGVQVTGSAEAPVVSLYSRPAMPDRDILGYMLMGRAISTESEESDMLMMGAGSLLRNYGGGLSELGITEIDIQGLFSGTGGLRLRRKIAEKWEVQSNLGSESGVDLFYIIDLK